MSETKLFDQAKQYIPGGVNSPVRAFKSVGGAPVFIKSAQGAYLYDNKDRQYIDYVGSFGPMILGHAHAEVVDAVKAQVEHSFSYGAPTELETEMAEYLCQRLPWIEKIRMVNSGTEATMSAIRLARGYTGRDRIIKFEGCYHGHADSLLVKSGSGALTLGVPGSAGVPEAAVRDTLTASFNDLDSVAEIFARDGDQVAAIIVEPIAGNMNLILPEPGFLQGLRDLCDQYGALLIMDEVMTGFRVHAQGAQGLYGVTGDLTTLGKIIGGGMPVGAFGGRADVMDKLAPDGDVYQAGTLSGNPVAMAAGLATLQITEASDFYAQLEQRTQQLVNGLLTVARENGVPLQAKSMGSMFGLFFTEQQLIHDSTSVNRCDVGYFKTFFHGMLEQGIYLAPSAFEAGFISAAHSSADIEQTVMAANTIFSHD